MSKPFCPMCGEPVKVVGTTTFHYESVAGEEIARLCSALGRYGTHHEHCQAIPCTCGGCAGGCWKGGDCTCGLDAALQGGSDGK